MCGGGISEVAYSQHVKKDPELEGQLGINPEQYYTTLSASKYGIAEFACNFFLRSEGN